MKVTVSPVKSQGIKTKLVPWINNVIYQSGVDLTRAGWIEPFFGTGVVGLNAPVKGRRIVGDTNPHIINFFNAIKAGTITPQSMREYLQRESRQLQCADEDGYAYYRAVKERFNKEHNPFDFIFLSRACFNGMMRFNKKGEWNVPFCKKPNRFAPAYITKICNQIAQVQALIKRYDWQFNVNNFYDTIRQAKAGDIIYCDPPYYGRYVDYYNGWTEENERQLFEALNETDAHFILSTWHHNEYRANDMISKYWKHYNISTQEHFYHGGGHLENRHAMVEALVYNFNIKPYQKPIYKTKRQLELNFAQ